MVDLSDIYSYGFEVFGDIERFKNWMYSPNQALDGIRPVDLLDSEQGRNEVKDLIGRIDYGVYS